MLTVIGIVAVALFFDYTNGFHDSANSISTIVATEVLRPRLAVVGGVQKAALGHGTHDAQKTMGVIAALLVATGHLQARGEKLPIPLWVVLAAHSAIALGTISGGWRIVHTLGKRITELRPARGMAAATGAAIALFGSTALGAPVSTTHTVAGRSPAWGRSPRGPR